MICFDSDDFGCNHEISDMCQSHDCRDMLLKLKEVNPAFKATLFAIPGEMTPELLNWVGDNAEWVELAMHGFYHTSNYECEKMTYDEFDDYMKYFEFIKHPDHFQFGFKAPGWQISDDIYRWLKDHNYWVADQAYNDGRRPEMPVYVIDRNPDVKSIHTHTWNCVGNGIYELYDQLVEQIKDETEFKFVSEMV